jgi:uncharacterized membrane protein YeaQ/YmgE (transglycosylase-associated protein family)
MTDLIINLISGAVGGNLAGLAMKDKSLGTIGNTIAGLLGGAGGSQILGMIAPALLDGLAGKIGGSGIGGAILMIIISLVKNLLAKKS